MADNRLSLAYLIVNYKHTVHNHDLAQKSFVLCIPTLRRIRQKYKSQPYFSDAASDFII